MKQFYRHSGLIGLALLAACSQSPTTVAPSGTYPSPQASGTAQSNQPIFPSASPSASPSTAATSAPGSVPQVQPSERPVATPTPSPQPTPGLVGRSNVQAYRDGFKSQFGVQPFFEAGNDPFSTFAVDVDTGAYTLARSFLNSNALPPADTVRPEEFLNYFNYHYPQPPSGKFALYSDLSSTAFRDASTRLLRVGLQGREVLDANRKQARLTFVIDVSGSMNRNNRLELAKQSLTELVNQLRADDQVGIVVYGNSARVALTHTTASNKDAILAVINSLRPEGSTNAEAGLTLGYTQASAAFQSGAINRVILCSDGVANVGERGPEAILERARSESARGITLTTLGFGFGEYNDAMMEQLANQGDGTYAYIDTIDEAKRVLAQHLTSTLQIIAKDARLQVYFNPEVVADYRLIGYENRDLADIDFRNDTIDAGEIGSNHSVTAVYEVRYKQVTSVPSPSPSQSRGSFSTQAEAQGHLGTVTLRYLDVDDFNKPKELTHVITTSQLKPLGESSGSLHLAASVAEFAEILRNSVFAEGSQLSSVLDLARTAQRAHPDDTRISEYVSLVEKAASLKRQTAVRSMDVLAADNPRALPDWRGYLIQQLGRNQ